MQIALTKKLADALKLKPPAANESIDPIFTWTANWIKTWSNSRTEDLLVLVNNATRFSVAVYEFKRKDFKKIDEIIINGIRNTLLECDLDAEIVDKYLQMSGELEYTRNRNRSAASWVTKAGTYGYLEVYKRYSGAENVLDDTIGILNNNAPTTIPRNGKTYVYPSEDMVEALKELV